MKHTHILQVLMGLFLADVATCLFETCDQSFDLYANQNLTINSPYFPNYRYPGGSSCRYFVRTNLDYAIKISCSMNLDQPYSDCSSQSFYVSRDGEKSLAGSEFLCGYGAFERTSISNELYFAYSSKNDGYSGYFSCYLSTVSISGSNCNCGWAYNARIVGGSNAAPNEYISNVGLVDVGQKSIFCAGAIISYNYILSAAHCFISNNNPSNIGALVGDNDISSASDTIYAAVYQIASIMSHPYYNGDGASENYDIAVLQTKDYIRYKRGVGPACLPYKFQSNPSFFDNKFITATGWGTLEYGGTTPNILQKVTLNTISNAICRSSMTEVTDDHICTYTKGKDTCQKDSGGSLYYNDGKQYTIGIVSYGIACAANTPSVATRVTSYIPWIEYTTGVNFCKFY